MQSCKRLHAENARPEMQGLVSGEHRGSKMADPALESELSIEQRGPGESLLRTVGQPSPAARHMLDLKFHRSRRPPYRISAGQQRGPQGASFRKRSGQVPPTELRSRRLQSRSKRLNRPVACQWRIACRYTTRAARETGSLFVEDRHRPDERQA